MLVNVTKDYLIDALQHVLKAVSTNPPIAILTGIHIQANENELLITASNVSMTILYRIPQEMNAMTVRRTGGIVVPARYFYEITRKLNAGGIVLEIGEDWVLTIKSRHSRVRLCGMDPAEFPSTQNVENLPVCKLGINSALLKSSIKQVTTAASSSETRPILTGVRFAYNNQSLNLIATDGIRLASRTIVVDSHANTDANVIIPGKNLYEASKILDGEGNTTEIEVGVNQIRFTVNNIQVQSALLEGSYPSIHHVIPKSYVSEVIVETACLLNAIERVTVLANKSIIRIVAASNKLDLLSRTAEIGDVQDEVPLKEMNGEDFSIALNGSFFVDILRCVDSEYVRLRFTGKVGPIVIQPVNDLSSTLFLITPVRAAEGYLHPDPSVVS